MKKFIVLCLLCIPQVAFADGGMVVTEVMANPLSEDHEEFIELYNASSGAIDVEGWQFTDGDALDTLVSWSVAEHGVLEGVVLDSSVVPAGGFAVVLDPEYIDGDQPYVFPAATVVLTVKNTTLGNGLTSTDAVTLYDAAGAIVSTYGTPVLAEDWHDADDDGFDGIPFDPGNGVSVERIDALGDDEELNWVESPAESGSTPGAAYAEPEEPEEPEVPETPTEPEEPEDNPNENEDENDEKGDPDDPLGGEPPSDPLSPRVYSDDVHLNELLPNPEGSDDAEFIELRNDGDEAVDLDGWVIADGARSHTIADLVIEAGGLLVLPRSLTGLALNNSGVETVELRDPNGDVKSHVEYEGAKEGLSYVFVDGEWLWTNAPSPGEKNVFEVENAPPIAEMIAQGSAKVREVLAFDGSESEDPDPDDSLEYFWEFGDGETCAEAICEHQYDSAGAYTVTLIVTDGFGEEDAVEHDLEITDYDLSTDIVLSEVVVNPIGPDKDSEWIELRNISTRDVDLHGWTLTDTKVFYRVDEPTVIGAGEYAVFDRSVTKIALNNSKETVYLIDPDQKILEGVYVDGGKEGESFAKGDSGWAWTMETTKGARNVLRVEEEEVEVAVAATAKASAAPSSASSASSSSSRSKVKAAVSVGSLAELRSVAKGSSVTVRGVVTVQPGAVSSQFIFIQDETAGLQLYSSKGAFPDLDVGSLVEVNGKISTSRQEFRVNVSSVADVTILGVEAVPDSVEATSLEHQDGELVSISGELISKKPTSWIVGTDDDQDVTVRFLGSGSVEPPKLVVGQRVTITGVVRVKKGVAELFPRGEEDIVVEMPELEVLGATDEVAQTGGSSPTSPWIPLLAAGYILPIGGFIYLFKFRVRGKRKEAQTLENWEVID